MTGRNGRTPAIALALALSVSACSSSPTAENISKFSSALDATTSTFQAAVDKTAAAEREANRYDAALAYISGQQFTLRPPAPAFDPQALQNHLKMVSALQAYAQILADLTEGEAQKKIGPAINTLGDSLKGFSQSSLLLGTGMLSEAAVDKGVKAASALGTFLTQEYVTLKITEAVIRMDPAIRETAAYLNTAIGSATFSGGLPECFPGAGLRLILCRVVVEKRMARETVLTYAREESTKRGSPGKAQLFDMFNAAYTAETDAAAADAAFSDVKNALDKMVAAHEALKTPDGPGTAAKVQSFLAFANRASSAYRDAFAH